MRKQRTRTKAHTAAAKSKKAALQHDLRAAGRTRATRAEKPKASLAAAGATAGAVATRASTNSGTLAIGAFALIALCLASCSLLRILVRLEQPEAKP